ncbi:hypothetical protein ISN45_Aa03g000370 [Arabidopsis thaliana x Arabidopsis arenosa]|uniref:TPX2 C-terminal domain-containing protein n=1 Tax=Arabidopsis thaliana x Arabidopsis arenosa TaxID=1240361 RepID=A0A8T2AQW0_9BRAS|nr:hypothetical protein ISN45_Aa03g000370 [Arabidopsis thaliana x Arabidopsis arenosa]
MGESACLMQPFSYAAPQGDSLGALGQSVSFGRFMSEKLDWEKWSAFSTHNPYVAEAERYSKPGSVAQKKAFFEAHYKKLAAARKAAAEEALLLQQQIPKPQPVQEEDINGGGNKDWLVSIPDLETSRGSLDDSAEMKLLAGEEGVFRGNRQSDEKENCGLAESDINAKVSSTGGEHVDEEKPILKSLQKKSKDSQPKSSTKSRVSKYNSSERTQSQKSSHKSSSYTFTPAKEFNRLVSIIRKIDGSRASSKPTKDCKTPLRTPSSNKVSTKGIADDSLSTPLSSNRRGKIAPDSSAKTGRGRWNFLPAETPSCFTPFGLRTEERAERRKKLEEKFKAMEPQNQKAEERSVEKEESKLRQRLCFKAKPLPNFYKQRPKSTDQTKKALLQ